MDLLFAESSIKGWGTEQHFAALATAMKERGHDVRCLLRAGSPLQATLRAADVAVTALPFGGGADPRAILALARMIRQRRPDWLVTNDGKFYWPFVLVSALTGARSALFRHWPDMPKSAITRRLIARFADRFILVSRFQRERLRQRGVDVSRMVILYNPIDTARLSPSVQARAQMRQALGIAEDEFVVGYVGRLVADKGVHALQLAAMQALTGQPRARLLWVGDGSELPRLRERAATGAIRQQFAGWNADVRGVYAAMDVVAVPSEYPDPCPRVPVEAQACGVPVVCSDAGGLPETFRPDASGLLVPEGDRQQLAAALLALLRDPVRRTNMGQAGREYVTGKFSFQRIAMDFEALLQG
ncbi:MAG: glycosyltransferase family 4 protein [Proteobacteria bacterium]|nr:glycosyltransferase family 4 protein [Pseudomonadota bacterium]